VMDAMTLLEGLSQRGIYLTAVPDGIEVDAPDGALTEHDRTIIRTHKPALLTLLEQQGPMPDLTAMPGTIPAASLPLGESVTVLDARGEDHCAATVAGEDGSYVLVTLWNGKPARVPRYRLRVVGEPVPFGPWWPPPKSCMAHLDGRPLLCVESAADVPFWHTGAFFTRAEVERMRGLPIADVQAIVRAKDILEGEYTGATPPNVRRNSHSSG